MYYNKSNFGLTPLAISEFIGDIINNNSWSKFNHDDRKEYVSVPVNVKETDKAYELNIFAPGLSKEDFKINIDKNILSVSFDKKEEQKEENTKWIRNEYYFRSFKRSFTLSDKVNQSGITAKYTDGVLGLTIPKKETVESTTQEIKVA
jgi:HSP20 family protein